MIKSPNQHILSYLDFYVGLTEPPGYAVMIGGAWGSGKSWLIRQHVTSDPGRKYLYVSLYGAKTADEVAERIFAARHPILASKGAVIAGRVLKGLLKVTTTIDIDGDKKGDLQVRSEVPDVMDTVRKNPSYAHGTLIFDDIERCLVKGNELWGFINQLVEHEGAKVILLSCETKMDAQEDYRRTKEKNVGMTLTVTPDTVSVLEGLISEAHQPAKSVLLEHKLQIQILFNRSGCDNLRVLRFAIRDFCRIFAEVPFKLQDAPVVGLRLLNSTLVLAFAIYSGELKPEDFIPTMMAVNLTEPKDEKPLTKWLRKYLGGGSLGLYSPPLSWWRNFFERGELQRAELNDVCESLVDSTRVPSWLQLAHFDKLSDSDFDRLLGETWKKLVAGEYHSVGPILHVVGTHMWAIQKQVTNSSLTLSTIQDEAKKAIGVLEHEGFFETLNSDEPQGPLYAYAGIVYAAPDVAEFRDIVEHVRQICAETKRALTRLDALRLLKLMREGSATFADALGVTAAEDGRLKSVVLQTSVLAEVDPGDFARALLSVSHREQTVILGAVYARLKLHMSGEREWVERVAEKIREQTSKPSLRSHMLCVRLADLAGRRAD